MVDRPIRRDLAAWAGDTRQYRLAWPAGTLNGTGPWTATATGEGLDPLDLPVTVAGDVMTITADVPADWLYVRGRWTLTDESTDDIEVAGSFQVDQALSASVALSATDVDADPAGTADTAVANHGADRVLHGIRAELPAARVAQPPILRARNAGLDATIIVLGDSISEGWGPTHLYLRWSDQLARLLNGDNPRGTWYQKPSANLLSSLLDVDWPTPSQDNPWSFTGTAAGSGSYGMDLNAALISTGGSASLPFAGDQISIVYTRQPAGGTHTVSIDGTQVATLNTNGTELVAQKATFGTAGDYGQHTLTVNVGTSVAGSLLLEGALIHDGNPDAGFGLRSSTVNVLSACHTLFGVNNFAGAANWATSLAARAPHLVIIALGWNDLHLLGTTLASYQAGLIDVMETIDAAMTAAGFTLPAYLLLPMPGLTASWRAANWNAADAHDPDRCAVLDLAHYLGRGDPDETTSWTIFDPFGAPDHPNNSGSEWIARQVADVLDPGGPRPTRTNPSSIIFRARDIPTRRSGWPRNINTSFSQTVAFDVSPSTATVGERRDRQWLEAGTYEAWMTYRQASGLGTAEILVGGSSAGTIATASGTTAIASTVFPSTVSVPYSARWPVTFRKTAAVGAVQVAEYMLVKTA